MILDADTVSNPIAIVLHSKNVALTVAAVVGARRPYRFAFVAVLPCCMLEGNWRERVHDFLFNRVPFLFTQIVDSLLQICQLTDIYDCFWNIERLQAGITILRRRSLLAFGRLGLRFFGLLWLLRCVLM